MRDFHKAAQAAVAAGDIQSEQAMAATLARCHSSYILRSQHLNSRLTPHPSPLAPRPSPLTPHTSHLTPQVAAPR